MPTPTAHDTTLPEAFRSADVTGTPGHRYIDLVNETDDEGIPLSPTEARQLAAVLLARAHDIDGQRPPMDRQNRVIHLDPDALVVIPPTMVLTGVRHDQIDGRNTVALGDLARHIVDMEEARQHVDTSADREHLAAVVANPAHVYVDSTTAPLPGGVEYGTNPTTDLLARVSAWERKSAGHPSPLRSAEAVELLRDAVQVLRTVAVDTLRVAAADVFDTAMPAHVAQWLEARALVLERGQDATDADILDAAIAELVRAVARVTATVSP